MKLIFLHGLGQDKTSWSKVQSHLRAYPNQAIDLFQTKQNNYKDVKERILTILQAENQPFILVGLSLGGVLALDLSRLQLPNLKGLVLSGTQYKLKGNHLYSLQLLIFKVLPKCIFQRQGADKQQMLTLLQDLRELDLTETVKGLNLPTLVICGSKDKANLASSTTLKELLPQAQLAIIPNGPHTLNTQCPEELAQEIEAFVKPLSKIY